MTARTVHRPDFFKVQFHTEFWSYLGMRCDILQAETALQQKRNIVITGAAGGIGSLLVQRFLANQDRVFAMDRNAEGLKQLRGNLANDGQLVYFSRRRVETRRHSSLRGLNQSQSR